MSKAAYPPVAVVGASALFPGMPTTFGFWRNILEGNDLLSEVPETHWLLEDYYDPDPRTPDKTYAERGGFLTPVDFSPMEFGVPPNIVPATDSAQLLALLVAKEVLNDAAGGQFESLDRDKISVVLGVASATELVGHMSGRLQMPVWERGLRKLGLTEDKVKEFSEYIASGYQPWQESTFPGLLGNVVAGRIANRLDLGGTNCVVDAACASSLAALDIAVNELYLGQSDVVITGGVDTLNDILMFMCFSKTTALSPSNDCRPFSDKADGTMLGEGIGMVALKRLDDAERDGDTIYGVIKAVGSSSDGRAKSIYAPVSSGQAKALRRAYERAGYGPETVELVEAHGTGTKAGDAAEFGGLAQTFTPTSEERQWCALGSVKSQVGHTKASAGSAGLFKVVMALHHKVLPPTIKIDRPNPLLDLENSAFYLNTETRPWVRGSDHPRRASVSSFGFGGTNFHVAIEEYTGDAAHKAKRLRAMPCELFVFGAPDAAALTEALTSAAADVVADDAMFAFLARHTQETFSPSSHARVSIVAADAADLARKLEMAAATIRKDPGAAFSTPTGIDYGVGAPAGEVAFLYPGQGSQYVGMGRDLAIHFDEVRGVFDRAADLDLAADGGLHDVVWPVPAFTDEERAAQRSRLTSTQWAQPAIGALSAGVHHVLAALGVKPARVGGHSFGELTSLWSAGAYSEADLLRIARKRGELMADAASIEGTMTAVVADIDTVRSLSEGSGLEVVVANHNGPNQVVVSGATDQIEAFEGQLRARNVKFKRLPVATAFHSPLVAGSSAPFHDFLEGVDVQATNLPVYANATAAPYAGDAASSRRGLADQIASPVRFVEQIEAMYAAGVRVFVEVGPNAVLTNLVGRILGDRPHTAIQTDRKGKDGVATLWRALGQLAAAGVELDLAPLWRDYAEVEDPRTLKKSPFTLKIGGANYDKPRLEEPEVLPAITYNQPAAAPAPAAPAPVAAAAPAPVAAAPSDRERQAWLHSFQDLQERTAQAHEDYQRQMIGAHTAFLQMAETSMRNMASILSGGAPASAPAPMVTSKPAFAMPTSAYANGHSNGHANGHTNGNGHAAVPAFALPTPEPARVEARAPSAPVASTPRPAAPRPAPAPAPAAPAPKPAAPAAPAVNMTGLMLEVVSEKTGYPEEMLDLSMELEADLGIDSIKRVEILSAMQEKVPSLPEVETSKMAALVTLQEIVDYMTELGAGSVTAPAAAPASAPAAAPAAPAVNMTGLMLEVVSEKTGYPEEMLDLGMELEADLGIDSIKRVEILSAMQEKVPSLPEVETSKMAALVTLQEIVDYMTELGAGSVAASPAAAPAAQAAAAPAPAAPAAPAVDMTGLMLEVVAEKTGYPAEMLDLSMELEADLGIDSIKRVEILSAMQDKVPSLPEVETSKMAALVTLQEIVTYMSGLMGAAPAAPAAAPAASAPAAPAAPAVDMTGLMLEVVAEKTGYPAEMLDLSMELEADLGIDSIKRVEILSAMQDKVPSLPEVETAKMAQLVTLEEIVTYMSGLLGGAPQAAAAPAASAPAPAPAAPTPAAPAASGPSHDDLVGIMLDVVADKTGYPSEMLDLDMELEADLGVDSIKRVEILSAMQDRVPSLPEVDTTQLAALSTLRQIVDHLGGSLTGAAAAVPENATLEAALSATPSVAGGLARYAVGLAEEPASGLAMKGLESVRTVEVTQDGRGVAQALAALLEQRGPQVFIVEAPTGNHDAVIFLGGLRPLVGESDAIAIDREAFAAARAVAPRFEEGGKGVFVTVQDTGGAFSLDAAPDEARARLGAIAGLAKTCAAEWPGVSVKAIDVAASQMSVGDIAEAITRELFTGGASREVALGKKGDARRVVHAPVTPVGQASLELGQSDVVVVSGGARGVTAASIVALAKRSRAKFVLLGRTALSDEPAAFHGVTGDADLKRAALAAAKAAGEKISPRDLEWRVNRVKADREVRGTLAAIAAAGGQARYVTADVRDAASLDEAFASARAEWGPITGLVHGAGVLADALISKKTDDQFDRVFDTKVLGMRALLDATAGDPIKLVCAFSSVAARTGNTGQSDYAMANEVLNKACLALAAARPELVVKSIGWGPWDSGMVTPGLKKMFEARGIRLIGLDEGAEAFADEVLDGTSGQVEVVIGGGVGAGGLDDLVPEQGGLTGVATASAELQPYLDDHRVQGTVVLPVVQVSEWIARAARASRAGSNLLALRDVEVKKGITLDDWGRSDARFDLTLEQAEAPGLLKASLVDATHRVRYSAHAELSAARPPAPAAWPAPTGLGPAPADLYGPGALFHGPAFQVLREVQGTGAAGATATLVGCAGAGWPDEGWVIDPALIDGCLQLALVWGLGVTGAQTLPLRVGSLELYAPAPFAGALRATLVARSHTGQKTVSDIQVTDASGAVVLELRGVEMFAVPGGA